MKGTFKNTLLVSLTAVFSILTILLSALMVLCTQKDQKTEHFVPHIHMMDQYDEHISFSLDQAADAARSVPKLFWIPEDAKIAPEPDADKYGSTNNAAELDWLLQDASTILDGQTPLFSTDIEILPGSQINYYLDDSIFAVTWKQVIHNFVYTISEIKISHPSQFRRHLAGGEYNSKSLYYTTDMAQQVNAVVGSSADYYRGREFGIIVYDGEVKRIHSPKSADVCYIDRSGNLHFSYRGDLLDMASAQKFVDDNDISFSIAFGPILIDNGVRCEPNYYPIGEVRDRYARAALCQMGELHYLVVAANSEGRYFNNQTIHDFAEALSDFGCQKAYTLDGGNTAAIAMDGKLINRTAFGYQRRLSDIIYFCTAVPERGTQSDE